MDRSARAVLALLLPLGLALTACRGGSQVPEPDARMVPYGPDAERQWLNVYASASADPTPVYLHAHQNGSTAHDIAHFELETLKGAGYTVISWESIERVETQDELRTCWDDAELVLEWIGENAADYNLDTDQIIVGGRSRGSGVSWKIAHSLDPAIRGIYMVQALGDSFWEFPSEFDPPADVSVDSPPITMTYRLAPGTTDSHDPERGIAIVERYEELGIGARADVIHSLGSDDQYYDAFPAFAASLEAASE